MKYEGKEAGGTKWQDGIRALWVSQWETGCEGAMGCHHCLLGGVGWLLCLRLFLNMFVVGVVTTEIRMVSKRINEQK